MNSLWPFDPKGMRLKKIIIVNDLSRIIMNPQHTTFFLNLIVIMSQDKNVMLRLLSIIYSSFSNISLFKKKLFYLTCGLNYIYFI